MNLESKSLTVAARKVNCLSEKLFAAAPRVFPLSNAAGHLLLGAGPPPMPSRLPLRDFAPAFALIAICAYFAFRSPQFLSARNLPYLVSELAIPATLAMGMLLVMLPG